MMKTQELLKILKTGGGMKEAYKLIILPKQNDVSTLCALEQINCHRHFLFSLRYCQFFVKQFTVVDMLSLVDRCVKMRVCKSCFLKII